MAITDFNKAKPIEVTSATDTPTISRALCFKITSGDDSTTGTGEIVLDWSNISSQADIGVYDENDNLLDYHFESFDATAETAVIWVYRDWVRDGSVQVKIAYGSGPSDQSVAASTVFDKEANLQAGYLLNESSGDALDVTSNNNDGTVNGATQGESGIVDGAYSFDGTGDYIDLGSPSVFDYTKLGIEFWFSGDNITTTGDGDQTIVGFNEESGYENNQWGIGSQGHDQYFGINIRDNNDNGYRTEFPLSDLSDNTFFHIFALLDLDNGYLEVFLNAQSKASQTHSVNWNLDTGHSLHVGRRPDDYLYFDGLVDNLLFYSNHPSLDFISAGYLATKSNPDFFSQQAAVVATVVATTDSPTNVTGSSATLNGTLESLEGNISLDVYFEYGTDTSYGNTTATQTISSVPTSFDADISGLTGLETYHYRAVATDGTNYWYGGDVSFYTADLRDVDETQSEFQDRDLDKVAADVNDYLRLAYKYQYGIRFYSSDSGHAEASVPSMTEGKIKCRVIKNGASPDPNPTVVDIGSFNNANGFGIWADTDNNEKLGIRANDNYSYSSISLSATEYMDVEAVYDGANAKLYIDGSLAKTISGISVNSATGVSIAIRPDSGDKLDGSFIYVEILDLDDNLIAEYRMEDGSGNTLTDSVNDNDGTLYESYDWVDLETSETEYYLAGNRLSPQLDLSSLGTVNDSIIEWTETLNNQTITIETRVSLDGGSTWTDWATATNGGTIPDLEQGTDISNGILECRQTLSTDDATTTPELHSLSIYIVETKSYALVFPAVLTSSKFTLSEIGGSFAANYEISMPRIKTASRFTISSNINFGYPHIVNRVQPDELDEVMGIAVGKIAEILNT